MLKKVPNYALGIIFIILFHLAWSPYNQAYLIFFSFIPIFILLDRYALQKKSIKHVIFPLSIIFLTSGLLQHLWVSNAHWAGTLLPAFVQTIILIIPPIFYYRYTNNGYQKQGFLSFILLTVSIQYLQNFWDLAWPWFNLGNSLSQYPKLIQWYQFTGGIGGTLIIIIINIYLYNIIKYKTILKYKTFSLTIIITLFFIILKCSNPITSSKSLKVLIYQPNIDAYTSKFTTNLSDQISQFTKEISKLNTEKETLIVCPETFIHRSVQEENVDQNPYIKQIQKSLKSPSHYVVTGANTTKKINPKKELDKASIRHRNGVFYKVYNSAILLNRDTTLSIYNKSRLVAGAETTPFSSVLTPIISKLFDFDLGGVSGNLGKSDKPMNFKTDEFSFSPIICFESVFGDYVGSFTEMGSDFITIITNDDWWGNTAGHKQHFEMARIRAIENQKYVLRSANTGISAIISPTGEVIKSLGYKEYGVIEGEISLCPKTSYFARNKHLIGKLSIFVFVMLLLQMETLLIRTKKR